MTNLYHILCKKPALEFEDMPIELEQLAIEVVNSGLVRIDAYQRINFARLSIPSLGYNNMFSKRELYDPNLIPLTKKIIAAVIKNRVNSHQLSSEIEKYIIILRKELDKYIAIDYEMELKLARILVQTIDPIVIKLVLFERVQIFISYSYNIADVLDVVNWQHNRNNSGMQSTDGHDVAIYISCAGDPLGKEEKIDKNAPPQDELTYGPGFPALARFMIIGAQELGHYSDIYRDQNGRQISRHSALFSGRKAKPHVKIARLADLENILRLRIKLKSLGLQKILELEKEVKFYNKYKLKNVRNHVIRIRMFISRKIFFSKVIKISPVFTSIKKYKYYIIMLNDMIDDMRFNLAPEADVYKNDNKEIEEAIACIEALARTPQQVNKWGKDLTKFMYPNLYKIYYEEVIPTCVRDYQNISKQLFTNIQYNYLPYHTKLKHKLIRFWKKKKFFK